MQNLACTADKRLGAGGSHPPTLIPARHSHSGLALTAPQLGQVRDVCVEGDRFCPPSVDLVSGQEKPA